jgi:probable F420-dependent oxidoreductase
MSMQFGGPLPWTGPQATRENLRRVAVEVERQGYGWVTAGDHLMYPKIMRTLHPRTGEKLSIDPTTASHEAFTLFSWLAAHTTTLRFMTSMLVLPYRTPFVAAKLVAGLDFVSDGRFVLGASVGWMKDEYDILNLPFAERGAVMDEYLEILCALLTEDGAFEGRYFSYPESWFAPRPARPVPIIIGGGAVDAVLRRTARYGQGWWPFPMGAAQVRAALPRLQEAWGRAGRSGDPEVHVFGRVVVRPDGRRTTTKDEATAQVEEFRAAGVTHLSMVFSEHGGDDGDVPIDAVLDASEWFATEVAPEFRA